MSKEGFEKKKNTDLKTGIQKHVPQRKTEVEILPLSLENEGSLNGMACVVDEFGRELSMPDDSEMAGLPFDAKSGSFNLAVSRQHYEFEMSLAEHKKKMKQVEKDIVSVEKKLTGLETDSEISDENDEDNPSTPTGGNPKKKKKKNAKWQKQDGRFKNKFSAIRRKIWEANVSPDTSALSNYISHLAKTRNEWSNITDHYGRTLLHASVEEGDSAMVKVLISAGCNVNVCEGCGATPLVLAVLKRNLELCCLLVENCADYGEKFFVEVPSPLTIAQRLGEDAIEKLFKEKDKQEHEFLEKLIGYNKKIQESSDSEGRGNGEENEYKYDRRRAKPVLFIGDQLTCKNIRSIRQKSRVTHGWTTEVPGDMHAIGYLCEMCYKAQGPGGFAYILQKQLKRVKVTSEAFQDKKFQDQNLSRIKEAVRDVAFGYGLAAVKEFADSSKFPSESELRKCKRQNGNHNKVVVEHFRKWIEECSQNDTNFSYHAEMIVLFGPLQQLYLDAIHYNMGVARETVWMLLLPLAAQLQKLNYWTESLVHVVNFTANWPLATRKMLQENCSVNINGKPGRGIGIDEFVETYMVRPMKEYSSGLYKHIVLRYPNTVLQDFNIFIFSSKWNARGEGRY